MISRNVWRLVQSSVQNIHVAASHIQPTVTWENPDKLPANLRFAFRWLKWQIAAAGHISCQYLTFILWVIWWQAGWHLLSGVQPNASGLSVLQQSDTSPRQSANCITSVSEVIFPDLYFHPYYLQVIALVTNEIKTVKRMLWWGGFCMNASNMQHYLSVHWAAVSFRYI